MRVYILYMKLKYSGYTYIEYLIANDASTSAQVLIWVLWMISKLFWKKNLQWTPYLER